MDQQQIGDGDENFIRQNAAAIAAALREQDGLAEDEDGDVNGSNDSGGGGSSSTSRSSRTKNGTSDDTSAYDLYRALCFDEPLVENVDACLALSRKLKEQHCHTKSPNNNKDDNNEKRLALSNRFVNGLWQCCQRTEASEPFATLAYTVFVEIPLCCCQSDEDLDTIRRYLGSYKGTESIMAPEPQPTQHPLDEENETPSTQPISDISDPGVEPNSSTVDCDAPTTQKIVMENEVWATESDPSDYDFGQGTTTELDHKMSSLELDHWMDEVILDPWKLSQPDPTLTYHQAQVALKSLLQFAKYNVLAPLFEKKRSAMAQQLTQLVLMLLTAQSTGSGDTKNSSLTATRLLDNSVKACGFGALWILRDAALQRNSCVSSYLGVLQTLLAVDEALEQDQGQEGRVVQPHHHRNGRIASATVVGITSLASWCSQEMDSDMLRETQECIIAVINDLSHIMEKSLLATTTEFSESAIANRNHLRNNMIPVLEVLAGIDWMGMKRGTNTSDMCSRPQVPQALLNSGFFRNLLVLGLEENIPENLKYQCHHSLLFLCVASPTVLGKYAWRYPGMAAMIQLEPKTSTGMVHSILWNALGSSLSSSVGASLTSLTQLRKPGTKTTTTTAPKQQPPSLSMEYCQTKCQEMWKLFCSQMDVALQSLTSAPHAVTSRTVQDFERLANSLVSCPFLCGLFVPLVDSQCLNDLRSVLATLPMISVEKPDEGDVDVEGEKPKRSVQTEIVARARKGLKTMALIFEGNSKASSKTD
jgi:hypothetical protein